MESIYVIVNSVLRVEVDNQSSVIVKKQILGSVMKILMVKHRLFVETVPWITVINRLQLEQQDVRCNYNRSGILCGLCPSGWSMM